MNPGDSLREFSSKTKYLPKRLLFPPLCSFIFSSHTSLQSGCQAAHSSQAYAESKKEISSRVYKPGYIEEEDRSYL